MARHWHQGSNVPGYLPESDVWTCSTKAEAISAALETVRNLREDDYRVFGSKGDYIAYRTPQSDYDLGIHVWIDGPCLLAECEEPEDL